MKARILFFMTFLLVLGATAQAGIQVSMNGDGSSDPATKLFSILKAFPKSLPAYSVSLPKGLLEEAHSLYVLGSRPSIEELRPREPWACILIKTYCSYSHVDLVEHSFMLTRLDRDTVYFNALGDNRFPGFQDGVLRIGTISGTWEGKTEIGSSFAIRKTETGKLVFYLFNELKPTFLFGVSICQ